MNPYKVLCCNWLKCLLNLFNLLVSPPTIFILHSIYRGKHGACPAVSFICSLLTIFFWCALCSHNSCEVIADLHTWSDLFIFLIEVVCRYWCTISAGGRQSVWHFQSMDDLCLDALLYLVLQNSDTLIPIILAHLFAWICSSQQTSLCSSFGCHEVCFIQAGHLAQ